MRDPSIMMSYERRENELSNDVYIFEKIILNYWVMYPKTWVSFFQGHPVHDIHMYSVHFSYVVKLEQRFLYKVLVHVHAIYNYMYM